MKISELINAAQAALASRGDLPVVVDCVEATLVQVDYDDRDQPFLEIL
jgi:hypothetical protein